jgi:hypothetical protein
VIRKDTKISRRGERENRRSRTEKLFGHPVFLGGGSFIFGPIRLYSLEARRGSSSAADQALPFTVVINKVAFPKI